MVLHNFSPPPPWESAPAHDGTTSRNTGRENRGREMPRDRSVRRVEPMGRDTSLAREVSVRPPNSVLARLADERGSATAEYAVATMAAVGFAGLLVVLLRGDEVKAILTDLVTRALTVAG